MNRLVLSSRLLARHASIAKLSARSASGSPPPWNYLWKPGPYPIDDEERAAAAKKYGMLLEDYKPNEEEDAMMGDYPCLPIEPQAEKSALYEWDCPEYRRNYGEPLQEEWWKYQEIRFTPGTSKWLFLEFNSTLVRIIPDNK